MVIEVRFFASLIEKAGRTSDRVEIEAATDVQQLWERLVLRHPALADVEPRPLVACDMVYAGWETVLDDVREVAFLPPVSGG